MPLKGVRYRVMTTKTGKKVRLAFKGGSPKGRTGTVVEAKNLKTGAVHGPEEFAAERREPTRLSGRARRRRFR